MAMHVTFILVRLLHVLSATLWVGAAVVVAFSIAPAVRATGSAGALVLRHLTQVQKLPYVVLAVGSTAILSGAYLIWAISGGSPSRWLESSSGRTYAAGAVSALIAALVGGAVNIPTANRLSAIAGQMAASNVPPAPAQSEYLARLRFRLAIGTRVAAFLLIAATAAMGAARYV
jgi:hypothetical protein